MSMDGTSIKIIDSPVRTSMRRNPPTVSPSEPISSLSYIMIRENIGAVIVIEKGKPIGIITEKDILERVLTQDKDIYKTHAKDIMSTPLISIEANQPIRDALKLMNDKKIRRLAVMEEGSLIGLITERRLLESICNLIV
jgi:CBS domain-containing protein